MAGYVRQDLHSAATTTAVSSTVETPADTDEVCAEINVTVAGTTGTYALEGSMDGQNWMALFCVPSDSDTAAVNFVYTSTGRRYIYLKTDMGRFCRYFRINPSVVTGQTFSSAILYVDQDQ